MDISTISVVAAALGRHDRHPTMLLTQSCLADKLNVYLLDSHRLESLSISANNLNNIEDIERLIKFLEITKMAFWRPKEEKTIF